MVVCWPLKFCKQLKKKKIIDQCKLFFKHDDNEVDSLYFVGKVHGRSALVYTGTDYSYVADKNQGDGRKQPED